MEVEKEVERKGTRTILTEYLSNKRKEEESENLFESSTFSILEFVF